MSEAARSRISSRRRTNGMLLIAGACLVVVLYFPVLRKLVEQWLTDENYRHGIIIPFISGFLVWRNRDELKGRCGDDGALPGALLIAAAAVLLVGGTAASELFTARVSLPILLVGASLLIAGRTFTARLAFPFLLLFTMIPLPYIIYYKLTFPLQLFSARLSAGILELLRINIIRKGNIIHLPNYSLEVIAACSGLRSVTTMLALALIFAALSGLSTGRRVLLVAAAVPAAIAANTFRLLVTAIGAYTVGGAFADGILHDISGLIVFLAGFLMLAACAGVLRWIK